MKVETRDKTLRTVDVTIKVEVGEEPLGPDVTPTWTKQCWRPMTARVHWESVDGSPLKVVQVNVSGPTVLKSGELSDKSVRTARAWSARDVLHNGLPRLYDLINETRPDGVEALPPKETVK